MLTLVSVLITLLLIGVMAYLIARPEPAAQWLVHRFLLPVVEYDPTPGTTTTEKVAGAGTVTLYRQGLTAKDTLTVVFIAGDCFVQSHLPSAYGFTNALHDRIGAASDVLVFSYPVRFKHTLHQTMKAIDAILTRYVFYPTVHAVGLSFGTLLAGAFQQKEASRERAQAMQLSQIGMRFRTFSAFSGLFDAQFGASVLTRLFRWAVLGNKVPGVRHYTCYGLGTIPRLVVSSKGDFLLSQSVRYLQHEPCESTIFPSGRLPHAFVQITELDASRQAFDALVTFLHKNGLKVDLPKQTADAPTFV